LEKFYHHLFKTDRTITALIDEMGLGNRLEWSTPATQVLVDGQEHRLDSPLALLRFSPLSLVDRLRMGAALAYLKALPGPGTLEGQTAARWTRRWMGAAAYRTVWQPQLAAKFGALADEIAAPWFWARIHDRTTQLGYLRGGFQQLYNRLAEEIQAAGGDLRFGTEVTAIGRTPGGGLSVETADGARTFDRVVSCLPTRVLLRLAPELPEGYRARYGHGQAYGAHCLILALDRRLTDSYWLSVNDPGYPFMVLVEHTNYQPPALYGGRHLIYLGVYRPVDDPVYTKSAEQLIDEYLPHVARIAPGVRREWITESWVWGAPFAQPIVTVDYKRHIPPFRTPLPGLYTANMFQVYPHDRGQNYSVELAETLARRLLAGPSSG
jgi:protoporphyrinogen oxidase